MSEKKYTTGIELEVSSYSGPVDIIELIGVMAEAFHEYGKLHSFSFLDTGTEVSW